MKKLTYLFCLLFFVSVSANAQNTTYYVSATGSNDNTGVDAANAWASLPYAVANAQNNATIIVLSGIYRIPQVVVDKALTIRGEGQPQLLPEETSQSFLLSIQNSRVDLEGFILDGNSQVSNVVEIIASTTLNDIAVRQNIIRNATASGIVINGQRANNLQISNNVISANQTGIQVDISNFSGSISQNQLNGNTSRALVNNSPSVIDAEANWWGNGFPNQIVSSVNNLTTVDFTPWLFQGTDTDATIAGFQPDLSNLGTRKTNNSLNGLTEAYDLLPAGGTIYLFQPAAGINPTYEGINARKSLTINSFATNPLTLGQVRVGQGANLTLAGQYLTNNIDVQQNSTLEIATSLILTNTDDNPFGPSSGTIIGKIENAPVTLEAGEGFSFLGASISAANQRLTGVTIGRINRTVVTVDNSRSIEVVWDIDVNESLTIPRTLTLTWDSELDGTNEFEDGREAYIWRSDDEGSNWELYSITVADVPGLNTRVVRAEGITEFSQWTVSDVNNPLPVVLTDIYASAENPHVRLKWETASEINSDFFAVERSENGLDFKEIGRIKAAGDSQAPLQYSFVDEAAAQRFEGSLFYRLRMVDFDATFEYSDIVTVFLSDENVPMISAYQDMSGALRLLPLAIEAGDYQVRISDLKGRRIFEGNLALSPGQSLALPVENLSQSIYLLRAVGSQIVLANKFKLN